MSAPSASAAGASATTHLNAGGLDLTITSSGSLSSDHHTMRVVSAHGDLTGVQELSWVADEGRPVGDAQCTQNIQVSPDTPAKVVSSLLICWRTSATKSVYTVAVDTDRTPSAPASVAILDKTWADLG